MAALTSGSWTIEGITGGTASGGIGGGSGPIQDVVIMGKEKRVQLKLTIDSGEVSSGGITLPGFGSVGLVRQLDYYVMSPTQVGTSGVYYVLNATGSKLVVNQSSKDTSTGTLGRDAAIATTATIPSDILFMEAVGW